MTPSNPSTMGKPYSAPQGSCSACRSADDTTSVYVLNDQPHVLAALVELIVSAPDLSLIGASTDPATAVKEITRRHPSVAVVDLEMSGSDGLDACRSLTSASPDRVCIVLSAGVRPLPTTREVDGTSISAILLKQPRNFPLVATIRELTGSRQTTTKEHAG